jgi:GrpB protein
VWLGSAPARDLVERSGGRDSPAHQIAVAQAIERREHGGVARSFCSRTHAAQRPRHLVRAPRLDGEQGEHDGTQWPTAHTRFNQRLHRVGIAHLDRSNPMRLPSVDRCRSTRRCCYTRWEHAIDAWRLNIAKPIIDVQISVAAFEPLDAFRVPLEGIGYAFQEDNPERTKRYFREPPGFGEVAPTASRAAEMPGCIQALIAESA